MNITLQWNPTIAKDFRVEFEDEDEITIIQGGLRINNATIQLTDIKPSDAAANLRFGFIQNAMPSYIQWYYKNNTRRTVKAMLTQRLDGPPSALQGYFFSGCSKLDNPNATHASIILPDFQDFPCTTGLASFSSLSGTRHLRLWPAIVNIASHSINLLGQCDWCITYDVLPQNNDDMPARVGTGAGIAYELKTRAALLHSTPWVVYSGPLANDQIAQSITHQRKEGNSWVIDDDSESEQGSDDEVEIIDNDMSGFIPPFIPNM